MVGDLCALKLILKLIFEVQGRSNRFQLPAEDLLPPQKQPSGL
jgi:hypothetical protein